MEIILFQKLLIGRFNPLDLQQDIYSLARHLNKILIFYEPRCLTLVNTRYFVEE